MHGLRVYQDTPLPSCPAVSQLCADMRIANFRQDPFELMEILKKVLVFLDEKHDIDLREEPKPCNEKSPSE